MPGIDCAAPDRTETNSGPSAPPNRRPSRASSVPSRARTSALIGSDNSPTAKYARPVSVVSVKPGGTGSPWAIIAASPAPFPPSSAAGNPTASSKV